MLYGTVIQYFPAKGFGFIRADFGPDVFFHVTALGACEPLPRIEPGQAVKYELVPGTESKPRRHSKRADDDSEKPSETVRPQAKLVELIDKIPGAVMEQSAESQQPVRHPRARKKKPTWRR